MFESLLSGGLTAQSFFICTAVSLVLGLLTALPEGLEVELITQELNLQVRGPAEQIAKLTADDVMVVVDFTGAEVGTATFPVRAVFTDGFRDVGVFRAESVSASVVPAGTLATETTAAAEATAAAG